MTLVRTIVAYCDATENLEGGSTKACFSAQAIDPNSTQPYLDLVAHGWVIGEPQAGRGKTPVICPRHRGGTQIEKPD